MNKRGIEAVHLASQYLAAAGISFLTKKDDDSHSNLGFSKKMKHFHSRHLNTSGDYLALNLDDFSLEWISDSNSKKLLLHNRNHKEVLAWIRDITEASSLQQAYQYQFHYSLPYGITDEYQYIKDDSSLVEELQLRTLIQDVLEHVLSEFGLVSEIRTWPHHMDSGAFAGLPEKADISLGMGLTIPDNVLDDYYYYISGYEGHNALATTSFDPLNYGMWINDGFTGAILPANQASQDSVMSFFTEAIQTFAAK